MSLITRCTACQTLFKVVPDQLRISDGWVRCGQCGEIFDAAQNLLVGPDEPDGAVEVVQDETFASTAIDATSEPTPVAAVPAPELAVDIAPTPTPEPDEVAPVDITPPDPVEPPPAPVATPSFMQGEAAPSAWHRRSVRRALALAALMLVLALAAQILRHERDRLAAIEPGLRPILSTLCQWTGCSITPMRQIESVVIDSSSFLRLRGDVYRLVFSLRNAAAVDIAMPAIELSVTDAQDQALSRRVFLPAEFGAGNLVLAAGADWGSKISLNVKPGGADRVAGYRLVAFYP
ncbi:MAG: DUF3426 domain-containing protein [Burkholderiaceae bacterium]